MEPIDTTNPAVAKYDTLDPRAIEEIHTDPSNAGALYRTMAIINDYEVYCMRTALTPAQRMEASSNWAKRGGLEQKQVADHGAGGAGFTINITIPGQPTSGVTVQGEATAIALTDE